MSEQIINTLVGGALVMLGGIIGQLTTIIVSTLERNERRQVFLREKYEALCECSNNAVAEFSAVLNVKGIDAVGSSAIPPSVRRCCTLAAIFFPEILQPAMDYQLAVNEYYRFCLRCFNPDVPASLHAQAVHTQEIKPFVDQLMKARASLDDAIIKNAGRYTKA